MRRLLLVIVALALGALALAACTSTSGTAPEGPVSVLPSPEAGRLPIEAHGLNVPWAVGGLRIERDGSKRVFEGEWPTVGFQTQRLWDSRTAWLDLEPAKGMWSFDHLDSLVDKAQANKVADVLLVLAGTPGWAASAHLVTDAAWMGSGSASMPTDIADWRDYVTTVATRYAGRITSYEIGNEPNLVTYWNGTPEQWREYVSTAATAIRAADPKATIVVSGGLVRKRGDVARLANWLAPIGPLAAAGQVDAVALHYYPAASQLSGSPALLNDIVRALDAAGLKDVRRWITEINVQDGSGLSAAGQARAVRDLTAQTQLKGFERLYWYAWTDLGPADLIPFQPGTSAADALTTLK